MTDPNYILGHADIEETNDGVIIHYHFDTEEGKKFINDILATKANHQLPTFCPSCGTDLRPLYKVDCSPCKKEAKNDKFCSDCKYYTGNYPCKKETCPQLTDDGIALFCPMYKKHPY